MINVNGFLILFKAENKKLFTRISSWVMMIIMLVIIVGVAFLLKYMSSFQARTENMNTSMASSAEWKEQLQETNSEEKYQLESYQQLAGKKNLSLSEKSSLASMGSLKKSIAQNEYYLNNNVNPADVKNGFWDWITALDSSTGINLSAFVALFVIIACAAAVAGEFSDDTMKSLISRPFSRNQILSAKLASSLLYGLVLFAEALVASFLMVALLFGFKGFAGGSLLYTGSRDIMIPAVLKTLAIYGLNFLELFVFVSLALMISVASRSRALATGISLFLLLVGGSISQILALFFNWGKYIFLSVTNFSSFILTGGAYNNASLGFALIVCAVYSALFLLTGYFIFNRRDI